MTPDLILEPPAVADLTDAISWYKQTRLGLEAEFRLCVEEVIERICRYPEAHPIVTRRLRRALLLRFPYGVFYLSDPARVRIVAILHTSRDPREWRLRHS